MRSTTSSNGEHREPPQKPTSPASREGCFSSYAESIAATQRVELNSGMYLKSHIETPSVV